MVDVVIIEGMFFHLLSDLPETFGFVSRSILRNVLNKVAIRSIKDNGHDIRGQGLDKTYSI